MPSQIKSLTQVDAMQNVLSFGPWSFLENDIYDEMFAAQLQFPALILAQIIGGVTPAITSLTTIEFLFILADQIMQIGLHGVNAQTSGFVLQANKAIKIGTCSINALSIFNTTTLTANVVMVIGGSA